MLNMGDFNRGRSSGGRDFGRRDFGGKSGDRQMFKTVCSKCNKECEVPFVPTGTRPVFCRDCFQSNRTSEPRRSNFDDRSSSQVIRPIGQPQYREQFEALSIKLDKILKILEPKITVVNVPAEVKEVKILKVKKAAKKSPSTKKKE